jgi:magnesium-protoporphyrin IX monomethyl ester (oxidative) cyclase
MIKKKIPDKMDVCLVNMPSHNLCQPSLALSLLHSILKASDFQSRVIYANLWFADEIGLDKHTFFQLMPSEVHFPDWLFASSVFPEAVCDDDLYLERIFSHLEPDLKKIFPGSDKKKFKESMYNMRASAILFIDRLAQSILSSSPKIVGCSSTFIQHVASLSILRKIHQLDDSVITVLGGANCEAIKGLTTHRNFPWVDYVVSGEAEHIIVDLCKNIFENGRHIPPANLPAGVWGPLHRGKECGGPSTGDIDRERLTIEELDSIPIPDFQDYFETIAQLSFGKLIKPGLVMETSRGCWWGAKKKCTFCGLNGLGIHYRKKSPGRVISEIRELEKKYNIKRIGVADNIISMDHICEVMPELVRDGADRTMFLEIKANLKRKQLETLKSAGVTWLIAGVESLDTGVLKIMNKGVTAWQNIQLLKMARELGIRLHWNYLWGFPGEKNEAYMTQVPWLPFLEHLQPPVYFMRLQLHRNSYYFDHAEELGWIIHPLPALSYIYDLPWEELKNISYYFLLEGKPNILEPHITDRSPRLPGIEAATERITEWRNRFWAEEPPVLTMKDNGHHIEFIDTRSCAREKQFKLSGVSRYVYLICQNAPLEEKLPGLLRDRFDIGVSPRGLADIIEELYNRGVILKPDDRLISLALKENLPPLPGNLDWPGGTIDTLAHLDDELLVMRS